MIIPKGVPSFYLRVYNIVDDPSLDRIISWSETNNSFIVWDEKALCREVLRKYSLGRNLAQFISELRDRGFERVAGSAQLEFGNANFLRGQPHLLEKMVLQRMAKLGANLEAKISLQLEIAIANSRQDRVNVEKLFQGLVSSLCFRGVEFTQFSELYRGCRLNDALSGNKQNGSVKKTRQGVFGFCFIQEMGQMATQHYTGIHLLKLMYQAPVTTRAHGAESGGRFNPMIQRYAPFLNTPMSAVRRWWFSDRQSHCNYGRKRSRKIVRCWGMLYLVTFLMLIIFTLYQTEIKCAKALLFRMKTVCHGLEKIHESLRKRLLNGETVVLACSSLRKQYREILRGSDPDYKPGSCSSCKVKFVLLEGNAEVG
ncbi:unnamed protein product [Thlaspi arvense]|uniref:HSF-type DNA-binding domain-containing protein n=1 Tax=Thlaspi arvense TaxID=13288 RepID=A0AAU9RXS1_THLAR|nr:unnamed protein product [Thlaspi arvense]